MPLFTVFMPCYNRAHTIHRVYESLQQQTLLILNGLLWMMGHRQYDSNR